MVWQLTAPSRTVPPKEVSAAASFTNDWKYYFNNAPLASVQDHPIIETALERALKSILACKRASEKGNIHYHTGPDNLTRSILYHTLRAANDHASLGSLMTIDGWHTISTTKNLLYKSDQRNWRTNASIY
jgi:hypothetical protein